jgi:CBS-domain-containing membrane protein
MTREPTTVGTDTSVKRATVLLSEQQISTLPVVDPGGRLCGVVGEADLIRDAFAPDSRAHMLPDGHEKPCQASSVREVMTSPAISVHETTDVAEAVGIMTSTGVKSLPVVDSDQRLVGVVSRSDLVRVRARSDGDIEHDVDAMLVSLSHTAWLVAVSDGRVEIEGPATELDRSIAEVAAQSVAGVVTVTVRQP